MTIFAHIDEQNNRIQTLKTHSFESAGIAASCLEGIEMYHVGFLAGLLHDMGKAKEEWNEYIKLVSKGEKVPKGKVNHTFCGVKYVLDHFKNGNESRQLTAELIAYAIGAHHGLFDIENPEKILEGENGFDHRKLYDTGALHYEESVNTFVNEVATEDEIEKYFDAAVPEVDNFLDKLSDSSLNKTWQKELIKGYLTRTVLSAVIEGDRLSTGCFAENRELKVPDEHVIFNWDEQVSFYENKISSFKNDTPINQARHNISEACMKASVKPDNIFRLTVPTGGGKTLSSLRYALHHAAEYKKKRIIYVIPLLSVLDQNSQVIHKFMTAGDQILEHHSDVVTVDYSQDQLDKRELLLETWDAPVIITTLVQFLDVCFSSKTGAIRRYKSLNSSVIIFDEIQSLPAKFLKLFGMVIYYLKEICNCSIVLCSATQPSFESIIEPLEIQQMVKVSDHDKEIFKRNKIDKGDMQYGISLDSFAEYLTDNVEQYDSSLIICNTKSEVNFLFNYLNPRLPDCTLYTLSTGMCKKHRRDILDKIGKVPGIDPPGKIVCIATQVVEAGIDFSFEKVFRILAGLDNIVQAAGRCNRSNEWQHVCDVTVIKIQGEERKLRMLPDIQRAQDSMVSSFYDFSRNPDQYENDYYSDSFIDHYYRNLFAKYKREKIDDYKVEGKNYSVRALLSTNKPCSSYKNHYLMRQAFKTAGDLCKVFEDEKHDVFVQMDACSEELISELTSDRCMHDFAYVKEVLLQLKPYTVSLFDYEYQRLTNDGMITDIPALGVSILDKAAYGENGVSVGNYINGEDALCI